MESFCAVTGISCGKQEVLDISFSSTTKHPKKVSSSERERAREREVFL
jgi:hypothetical protein